jgi:broad specificity phosphatase PhoE
LTLTYLFTFITLAAPNEILFIRHGEGEHNKLNSQHRFGEARELRDPHLTATGIEQARAVGKQLALQSFDLVLVSPMFRTLETAEYIFENRKVRFVADPDMIEFCHVPVCTGSESNFLRSIFRQVDFGSLSNLWFNDYAKETREHFLQRVAHFKQTLFELTEKSVIVVSHAGFLRQLLGVSFKNCDVVKAYFDSNGQLVIQS